MRLKAHKIQHLLKDEYLKRMQRRQVYSLRSFAKSLGSDPTAISRIMKGERIPTPKTIKKIATRLGLDAHGQKQLLAPNQSPATYHAVDTETVRAMGSWYFAAIIELTHFKNFKYDVAWIARHLGISSLQVSLAIEALLRTGILIKKSNTLTVSSKNISTIASIQTDQIMRNVQSQILQQASNALEDVAVTYRDHSTVTVATNIRKIAQAKDMIKQFRRELAAFLEDDADRNVLYHVHTAMFPIAQKLSQEN